MRAINILLISPKSLKQMKQKVKEITRKTLPISFEERITKLKAFTRGYFSFSEQFQKSRRTVPIVTQLKISFACLVGRQAW